jgi:hypothetical protein
LSKGDLIAGEGRALIPEGKYTALCFEVKRAMVGVETSKGTYAKTPKVILSFKVTEGRYQEEKILMYLNINYKKIPAGAKFYQIWVMANNSQRPRRNDRMSLEVFKNHIFTVGVKTVKPKFRDGTGKPQPFWYSRADEIYEKVA